MCAYCEGIDLGGTNGKSLRLLMMQESGGSAPWKCCLRRGRIIGKTIESHPLRAGRHGGTGDRRTGNVGHWHSRFYSRLTPARGVGTLTLRGLAAGRSCDIEAVVSEA